MNLDSECDSYMRSYSTIPLIVGTVVGGIGLLVDGTGFIAACIMVKKSRYYINFIYVFTYNNPCPKAFAIILF